LYLKSSDETHAIISNHLATATAALYRWHAITQDSEAEIKARELFDRIVSNQSQEGWFREYEGFDPGYQSLCTYYLADLYQIRKDLGLLEILSKSIDFLSYFMNPDGSFGGNYGSRSTRFYYPSGVMALSSDIPLARAISGRMLKSVSNYTVVTLSSLDDSNLIPMFNSYCWGAQLEKEMEFKADINDEKFLFARRPFRKVFSEAGIVIDAGKRHYTIISTDKGGLFYHYVDGSLELFNDGLVASDTKGKLSSTQTINKNNVVTWMTENVLIVKSEFFKMPKQLTSPFHFFCLRILCLSVFRWKAIREITKRIMVKILITNRRRLVSSSNERTIHLGKDLSFSDNSQVPANVRIIAKNQPFVPIHMASQGYWQIQDEDEYDSAL
ncbi:MAG: hypothetical protein CMI56_01500, partial [Parcubacteria group bacterium]|nr:hypothetical protein [Parcubacteria group bacterium]